MTTTHWQQAPLVAAEEQKVERVRKKPGRKTNEERALMRAEAALAAEEKRRRARQAKRFYADTWPVMVVLLGLSAILTVSSFTVSFAGLYAAAAWAVGTQPVLQIAAPLMLDVAIITFTLALFVERERGEKVVGTWIAIGVFAVVSSCSNILHTLTVSTATTLAQIIVGAVISGGSPILLAFVSDKVAVKVFKGRENA